MKKGRITGTKRFSRFKKIMIAFVIILSMITPLIPASAAGTSLELSVTYGLGSMARINCNIPFDVTVTNKGGDFNGYVQVIVPTSERNLMYEKDLSIAAGATKTVSLSVPFTLYSSAASVRITNQKGKVVRSETLVLKTEKTLSSVNIGVLSDDFSALSYISGVKLFYAYNTNISTRIIELSADSFPSDENALDMLDFIIISNFSTDKLSDTQLTVLNNWVRNGGALIIGTGSTVSKTLSGLKNIEAFSVLRPDSITRNTYRTTYGLRTASETYTESTDIIYNPGPNWSTELSHFGSDVYNKTITLLQASAEKVLDGKTKEEQAATDPYDIFSDFADSNLDYAIDSFADYFGYPHNMDDYDREHFKTDLYENILVTYCKELLVAYLDKQEESGSQYENVAPVESEITQIRLETSFQVISGDIDGSEEIYPLAKTYYYGNGSVMIAGIDFTQNPLASYRSNDVVFRMLLKQGFYNYITNKITDYYQTANNRYSYNDYDRYSSLFGSLGAAAAPPFLLYFLVLVLYLVSIFVSFSILKKKRKNILFWGTQAASAFIFAFIIFICSFTTRVTGAEMNIARVKEFTENGEITTDIARLVMPSKKAYRFSVANERNLVAKFEESYSYYNTPATPDLNSYFLGVNKRLEDSTIIINNNKPLNAVGFVGTSIDTSKQGRFVISNDNPGSIMTVTNNTGYNIENAFVIVSGVLYMLGDLKNGETYNITASTDRTSVSYYYNMRSDIMKYIRDGKTRSAAEFFFGLNSRNYKEVMTRMALFEYLRDDRLSGYSTISDVVGGFVTDSHEASMLTSGKIKEIKCGTLVYQTTLFTDREVPNADY